MKTNTTSPANSNIINNPKLLKDDTAEETKSTVKWSPENEKILVEWCDIAQCYKWLNMRAHNKYARLHAWFTIPAIILSTISGTASFAQESIPESLQSYATMSVGTINIAVGILATIQQYLKISELNESFRVSSIAWDKYARNIRIEIAKAPLERPDASIFIKHCRDEFDRLMETSPSIPQKVINEFMNTFAKSKDPTKKDQYNALKKPDICDIIISAEENRHHWYKSIDSDIDNHNLLLNKAELETQFEEELQKNQKDLQERQEELQKRQEELFKKEQEMINIELKIKAQTEGDLQKRQDELRKREQDIHDVELKIKQQTDENALHMKKKNDEYETKIKNDITKIKNYIKIFEITRGREPIDEEITDYFKNEIDNHIINTFIQQRYDSMV